jgi:hypothetical protein
MDIDRESIQQIAVGLGGLVFIINLFWALPIAVSKNWFRSAERLSGLPGISKRGGLSSGLIVAGYIVVVLATISMTVAVMVGPVAQEVDSRVGFVSLDTDSSSPEETVDEPPEKTEADKGSTDSGDSSDNTGGEGDSTTGGVGTTDDTDTPTQEANGDDGDQVSQTPAEEDQSENTEQSSSTPSGDATASYDSDDVSPFIAHPTGVNITVTTRGGDPLSNQPLEIAAVSERTTIQMTTPLDKPTVSIEDELRPGNAYTVTALDYDKSYLPDHTTVFDPGKTDNVTVRVPDITFSAADEFAFQIRTIPYTYAERGTIKNKDELINGSYQRFGTGVYNEGDYQLTFGRLARWEGDLYSNQLHHFNRSGGEYETHWAYPDVANETTPAFDLTEQPAFAPTILGVDQLSPLAELPVPVDNLDTDETQLYWDFDYNGTTTLSDENIPAPLLFESLPSANDGREVHVIEATPRGYSTWLNQSFTYYSDYFKHPPRVYVDAETGYVLRWEAPARLATGATVLDDSSPFTDAKIVIDFWNHEDIDDVDS